MSDQEPFLARWSRRKRAATEPQPPAETEAAPSAAASPPAAAESQKEEAGSAASAPRDPPLDPATLPSIDSITAVTDIRPFLAPGVPPELTHAALRRAWTTDRSIRDFVGLAENAWDFNSPDSITGFGAIEMTAQLRSEITRMVGRSLTDAGIPSAAEVPEKQASAGLPDRSRIAADGERGPSPKGDGEAPEKAAPEEKCDARNSAPRLQGEERHIALQEKLRADHLPSQRKRLHGRALPE